MSAAKRKRNGNKTLYIILFILIVAVLAVTFIVLPKGGDNENEGKERETVKETTVFDKLDETDDLSDDETEETEDETETETEETLDPAGVDVPVTVSSVNETDSFQSDAGATISLNITKPVFSADEYGENAARLNELIDLKTDVVKNKYAQLRAHGTDSEADRDFNFTYEIRYNDNGIVSVLYCEYYKSDVDEGSFYGSINYDMNMGNTISVVNLLPDGAADYHTKIADFIVNTVASDPDSYTVTDEAQLRALYENNKTQFVCTAENITVYFQPGVLNESATEITSFTVALDSII